MRSEAVRSVGIVNKKNASQSIVEYILDQIQTGALKKGDKLMTEHEFAKFLGVSRIPLREALCALGTVGILESRQGGGTYVTSRCDPGVLGRMLYDYAILENVDLRQVIDVRILLEPEAARQAAIQGTQRQKEEIWENAKEYEALILAYEGSEEDNRKTVELDRVLHERIARAAHNDFLWMLLGVAGASFGELNNKNFQRAPDHAAKDRQVFAQHHLDIAQAILDGNGAQAAKCMEKHLQYIKNAHAASSLSYKNQ